jgi:ABC-type protease/lipase transport system fused ATPase/permease subunit
MAVMALIVLGMLDEVRGRMLIRVGDWVERAFSPEVVASGVRVASSPCSHRPKVCEIWRQSASSSVARPCCR